MLVSHADGLQLVLDDVHSAIERSTSPLVAISGLPGVGKTALASAVFESARSSFGFAISIDGRDRVLDVPALLDWLFLHLPIEREPADSPSDQAAAALGFLRGTRSLLYVDNAESLTGDSAALLAGIPTPSVVLVSTRDATPLRRADPRLYEVVHPGMNEAEMQEFLANLMEGNPPLLEKISLALPSDVDRLIEGLGGWPQALLLAAATLSTSAVHVADLAASGESQAELYEKLLGDVLRGLQPETRTVLFAAGFFPVSFTIEGLAACTQMDPEQVTEQVNRCQQLRLVAEIHEHQFRLAHPVLRSFIATYALRLPDAAASQSRAEYYLNEYAIDHGGQPDPIWANFKMVDREFENQRALIATLLDGKRFRELTVLFGNLFSYSVERGHWQYVEQLCREVDAANPAKTFLCDWLIWWSWLRFYLHDDFESAASLGERCLRLGPRLVRQRFQAHRRALVAYGRLGDDLRVQEHFDAAALLLARADEDSDEWIDLKNSYGDALVHLGGSQRLALALTTFCDAEALARGRLDQNTREVGVALLGQARSLLRLGRLPEALDAASAASEVANSVAWLRGMAESSSLLAELNAAIGDDRAASAAEHRARLLRRRLRSATGPPEVRP